MHKFDTDLYESLLKVCICGFIRPEKNFETLDALIAGINEDIEFATNALNSEDYQASRDSDFFRPPRNTDSPPPIGSVAE